ncbi:FtsB family cell division protein [Neobacillus kokaensis]|uniref:Cell division protein DIVIC n=1 Tax=Neobacillus kokaensis TaxID=2759023 RepID=A0ABQ3N7E5_9BACI|nr:septum formation initiator family protein [Neobacillus kokaensis]GHI00860.1 cell division protein DIVIC [Neobacillus kokaensis]
MGSERQKNVSKIQTTYVKQQEYAEIASARKRKLLIRRLSLFFVLACIISYFMISSLMTQSTKLEASAAQQKKLNQEFSELKKQEKVLKEEIVKLNDKEYIAKLARKEYFFSKKNEIIFNIPDGDKGK